MGTSKSDKCSYCMSVFALDYIRINVVIYRK